jgi:hypothetical protein
MNDATHKQAEDESISSYFYQIIACLCVLVRVSVTLFVIPVDVNCSET